MPETIPEIQRTNLASTVLYLKALGIHDVLGFDFFESPGDEGLCEALLALHALGALDSCGQVTPRGQQMSRLPLDPCLARTLLQACAEGCLSEVLAVAALASTEPIWNTRRKRDADDREVTFDIHLTFLHPRGDHLTFLNVWRGWENSGFDDEWVIRHELRCQIELFE